MVFQLPGYQVQERLQTHSKAQIYRAHREQDGQPVILKLLPASLVIPERRARFQREFEILRSLNNPGVIKVYDILQSKGDVILVLEDSAGVSLDKILQERKNKPFTEGGLETFLHLALQLAETLGYIHQQHIIHKDINPANIIFNSQTKQVKIIDFGLSTILLREQQNILNPNILEGTLPYISPEQTGRMNRAVDYRSDFYSLGVTFYELLTGQVPFIYQDSLELIHAHLARQPLPAHKHNPQIPQALSAIVSKLMAKNGEDRYQSAYGLRVDLENCLQQWQENHLIHPFTLGQQDISDRFQVPQKLYGREEEVKQLLDGFERVRVGQCELMLITGPSGIGKSALVQELYKPLTAQRGYFISGKYDQFQRNIPYSALIQACKSLIQQVLTESEEQIYRWRESLQQAAGNNGQILIDVLPDLAFIMGVQPAVAPLNPAEAEIRFNLVFTQFIRVFTQAEHPLVIFLDDLQWADGSSLRLLKEILTYSESQYLLLLGAYRHNEIDASHPLQLVLEQLQKSGKIYPTIQLRPFGVPEVEALCAEALFQPPAAVAPLAELLVQKTAGNPFFVGEFLKSLYHDQLLKFNLQTGQWEWQLNQIRNQVITDNVVAFMAGKVKKLPENTQKTLRICACFGNRFELQPLALVAHLPPAQIAQDLEPALTEGLILPLTDNYQIATLEVEGLNTLNVSYRFAHDRIQQAVYSLLSEGELSKTHYQIGQTLLEKLPSEEQENLLFDITNQLNQGQLHLPPAGRLQLAELNWRAGHKAKAAAANEPALNYFLTGLSFLPNNSWQSEPQLTLKLHIEAAEAAYLTAHFDQMAQLNQTVLQYAQTPLEKVRVYEVQIQAYTAQNKKYEMVKTGLQALQLLGVSFPENPKIIHVLTAVVNTRFKLGRKSTQDLLALPTMNDPLKQAAIRIMLAIIPGCYTTFPTLLPLFILKMVNFSLQYGNSPASSFGYAGYGLLLCGALGDIPTGNKFGQLALKIIDKFPSREFTCATLTYLNAFVTHWQNHYRDTLPGLMEAYQTALDLGNMSDASLAALMYDYHSYFIGRELPRLEKEMAKYSQVMEKYGHTTNFNYNELYRQATLNLLGLSENPQELVGTAYDKHKMMPIHEKENELSIIFNIHLHEAILCYLFGNYQQALEHIEKTQKYLDGAVASLASGSFHFYDALIRLAAAQQAPPTQQKNLLKTAEKSIKKIAGWMRYAPMNFAHKYHLMTAEKNWVTGRPAEAGYHYEQAINLARENRFTNEEALAQERAGMYFLQQKNDHLAHFYLQEAYLSYRRWGANAKVEQLQTIYPLVVAAAETTPLSRSSTGRTTNTITHYSSSITPSSSSHATTSIIDLSSVLRVAEIISGEIRLESLLETLLRLVIENAGADYGCLLLEKDGVWRIEARGNLHAIMVLEYLQLNQEKNRNYIPETVLNYVVRTREQLLLNAVQTNNMFGRDPYFQKQKPHSLLCLPLLNRGQLSGIVYLENNLTADAFTNDRLATLNLLSSQAAISIDNARLYQDLTQANDKLEEYNLNLENLVAQRTKELQTAVAELDAFAHTVAHDLKAPLGGVIGYAEMLIEEQELFDIQEQHLLLNKILRSGHNMRNIIDGLLALAMTRQDEVTLYPIHMHELIESLQNRFAYAIKQAEAELIVGTKWPVVLGEAKWVEEVWANYLSNALKYGGSPAKIELGADELDNGQVCFWVKDNGAGIPAEQQTTIFMPFTRLNQRSFDSHGLGLSIVTRIMEKLGGKYGVESQVGQGSKFYFTLPAATQTIPNN